LVGNQVINVGAFAVAGSRAASLGERQRLPHNRVNAPSLPGLVNRPMEALNVRPLEDFSYRQAIRV
jgi:hypothetical protein